MKMVVNVVLLLMVAAGFSKNLTAATAQTIEVWTRGPGLYAEGREVKKVRPETIQLDKFKLNEIRRYDVQYDKEMAYRGIGLRMILRRYNDRGQDTALLHFSNGMAVPVNLKGDDPFGIGEVFVALEVKVDGKWAQDFPEVAKEDTIRYRQDPHPIVFGKNKVVLLRAKSSFEIKGKDGKTVHLFTPFAHTTSLIGIEFIKSEPYYQQFEVDNSPETVAGLNVFRNRCQFCHGVRKVGAVYGWDYVIPIKISEKRNPKGLHQMVKYPKADPIASGTVMPNQEDLTAQETATLWKWIKAVGEKPLRPYKP